MWKITEPLDPDSATRIVQSAVHRWTDLSDDQPVLPSEGVTVTPAFPNVSQLATQSWLGRRLIVWPNGVCPLKPVSVLSSHLGKRLDQHLWWFDLLRTIAVRTDDNECLYSVSSTSSAEAVNRCAELFQIPRLIVQSNDEKADEQSLAAWLIEQVNGQMKRLRARDEKTGCTWKAVISPELELSNSVPATEPEVAFAKIPAADRALIIAARRVYVLGCRRGGNVLKCLEFFDHDSPEHLTHLLAAWSDKIPRSFQHYPESARIIPWIVSGLTKHRQDGDNADQKSLGISKVKQPDVNTPLSHPSEWLCHWTRPRFGKWPEQLESEFLDELILGAESSNRSALAALLRIVESQCLFATGSATKPSVSFTEVPLSEFRKRRVFRGHRNRHDFEPWGIAVRRQAIEKLGGRPVIYGDRKTLEALSAKDVPFFQSASTASGDVDWTEESEWRVTENVDLSELDNSDVVVFVDTPAQQLLVQQQCDWAVVCLPLVEENKIVNK